MLTPEELLETLYMELGNKEYTDYDDIVEELCKCLILFIAEYTWPFIWAQCIVFSIYIVYFK